ncbi:hypothetical protein GTQ99_20730 [Kineococcus sp. T13]|uniref:hypothetical protein n=1 Tax=Kineococcus vitellinus TaxID=2696565 RepID=UPI0014123A2A|nr:hypothetical protein [Kineococcus vitellinus]
MAGTGVPAPLLFSLEREGDPLAVEVEPRGHRARVRLRRGGELLGERTALGVASLPLPGGGGRHPRVVVRLLRRGDPLDVVLVEPGPLRTVRTPFEPPAGTTAARWHAWQRRHPALWAARHVVLAVGEVALVLLGIAAFVQLVLRRVLAWLREQLPSLDLPGIPWPDWDLPRIPWPDWDLPTVPWPDWDLPDLHAPAWLLAVLATAKLWVPVLIALAVAVREVRRRRAGAGGGGGGCDAAGRATPPAGAGGRPEPDREHGRGPGHEHGREHEHEEPGAHRRP